MFLLSTLALPSTKKKKKVNEGLSEEEEEEAEEEVAEEAVAEVATITMMNKEKLPKREVLRKR